MQMLKIIKSARYYQGIEVKKNPSVELVELVEPVELKPNNHFVLTIDSDSINFTKHYRIFTHFSYFQPLFETEDDKMSHLYSNRIGLTIETIAIIASTAKRLKLLMLLMRLFADVTRLKAK